MNLVNVDSSFISAVGYDPARRLMEIRFKRDTHQYHDVPVEIYHGLITAPSAGSFFHSRVKGKFESEKRTWTCDICEDVGLVDRIPQGSQVPQTIKCPAAGCTAHERLF